MVFLRGGSCIIWDSFSGIGIRFVLWYMGSTKTQGLGSSCLLRRRSFLLGTQGISLSPAYPPDDLLTLWHEDTESCGRRWSITEKAACACMRSAKLCSHSVSRSIPPASTDRSEQSNTQSSVFYPESTKRSCSGTLLDGLPLHASFESFTRSAYKV